jgi:ubiquinone/menaquinone biosynthesis C-methylase UbiE
MPGEVYDAASAALGNHAHEILFGLVYEHLRSGQRVLDVGIGSGLASELFHRAGLRVVGVDLAEGMLASCRRKGVAESLVVHDLSAAPWPFATAGFDHAIACGVIHFFAAPELFFDELSRVVRPGGTASFTTLERPPPRSAVAVHVHPRARVIEQARARGLVVAKDVAFSTPSSPSRDADVGFRAYLARRGGFA